MGGTTFTKIENLVGQPNIDDTFVVTAAGSLSGLMDGSDGPFDSLILAGGSFEMVSYLATGPDSGTVTRDGDVLTYAGLEPIDDNMDVANRVIRTSNLDDRATLLVGAAVEQVRLGSAEAGILEVLPAQRVERPEHLYSHK